MSNEASVAVVAGVGPGLGFALARKFAAENHRVALLARTAERLEALSAADPERLRPFACDLAEPFQVDRAFELIASDLGVPDCVVFNASSYRPDSILDISPETFEAAWRVGCFAGFLVGQAAARAMLPRGRGSILFTGATASLRGSARFANLASPKFALRGLAQSMARELGPKGLHVAHVIIDGMIRSSRNASLAEGRGPDSLLDPDAIAEAYWQIHMQPRSAWTHEVDLRPWVEKF